MTVPRNVRLARHIGDLDEDGHDIYARSVGSDGAYTVEPQAPQSRRYLMRDGTWRDPFVTGLGTLTVGTIATITDDTKYNAWPQVVRLRDRRLLMAYVKADTHNLDNTGNIVGRIGVEALDGSVTWDNEFTIADETLGAINISLGVLDTGRVVAVYNVYDYPTTPTDAVRVRYSDDQGETWSAAYVVDSTFTDTVTNSSARIVQRRDGAVLLAVYGKNTGDTYYTSRLFVSTDRAETWGGETTIADGQSDSRQYYEPSLTLLDNDDILCLIRTSGTAGDMYQFRSTDGGPTWSAEGIAFGGYSPANALQLSSGTVVATVRGNAAAKLEAFTSIDRGAAWTSQGILDSTSYTQLEYACPVELLDGQGFMVVYGVQPTSSTSDANIKTVRVVEDTTTFGGSPTGAAGGDLGGTYPDPTVNTTHSGSSHADTQAAAEATAAAALAAHIAASTGSGLLTVDPGTVTYDHSGADVVVGIAAVWGYDGDGPYYDSGGVVSGEEAILALDPTSGELVVVPYIPV